ncbi:hypothetical protein L345_09742, partial [Ophiophagus hannah]
MSREVQRILDKIEDVQESIFTQEPKLLKALVPIQTMHLTIFVAHLKTEDDIKRAISALEHSKAEVRALLQRQLFCMTFHGTGQFNNKVIYVKMSADEQHMLSKIAGMVLNSFMEMNIDVSSSRDVKPQLTFLKLSKDPAWRRKTCKLDLETLDLYVYSLFMQIRRNSTKLASEKLVKACMWNIKILLLAQSRIDLCAMHKKRQDSGYYHCEYSVNICPCLQYQMDHLMKSVESTLEYIQHIPGIVHFEEKIK